MLCYLILCYITLQLHYTVEAKILTLWYGPKCMQKKRLRWLYYKNGKVRGLEVKFQQVIPTGKMTDQYIV